MSDYNYTVATGDSTGTGIWDLLYILRHFVHKRTCLEVPATTTLHICKFGLNFFAVLFFAWDTLCPYIDPLLQFAHR